MRLIVVAICVAAIAGMIVTSILDHIGAAITFGLISAAAILCSMVATAVAASGPSAPAPLDEGQAAQVEALVQQLVDQGADEQQIRTLVGEAVKLGRGPA